MREINLRVEGMHCAACVARVEAVLSENGCSDISINLANGNVLLSADDAVSPELLCKAINELGFKATAVGSSQREIRLHVDGMHCAACVARVEAVLSESGCHNISINLASGDAMLLADESIRAESLCSAINELGFDASIVHDGLNSGTKAELPNKRKRSAVPIDLIIAIALSLPLFSGMVLSFFLPHESAVLSVLHNPWFQFALATPVQFWCGRRFYTGAYKALRARYTNMDVLVSLGTSAAYFLSLYNTIAGRVVGMEGLYFEASTMIVTLVLLGKTLEARATGKAGEAVEQLLRLAPEKAFIETEDGIKEISASEIKPGDICVVKKGEKFPCDGILLSESASADEAMLTGESMPAEKHAGDELTGATINLGDVVRMKTTRVGSETVLSEICRMVERAQSSKAPVQRMADKISAVFVPAVLCISLLTLIGWLIFGDQGFQNSLMHAVTVVVVACPCALGLATPTAVMVGVGRGALHGVLFRSGEYVEQAAQLDVVVLDKTGTITVGKPSVTDIVPFAKNDSNELLSLAASAEALSAHPLAAAICNAAQDRGLSVDTAVDFSDNGLGVSAKVGGRPVSVLSPTEAGLAGDERVTRLESEGKTAVVILINGSAAGLIGIADSIRPDASEAVSRIKEMGMRVIMLTGDNERAAAHISALAGIDEYHAHVRADEKPQLIKELQEKGLKVAMIGDGINDAPALSQANVGISVGGGSDIAIESAGVTLLRAELNAAADALSLARHTMRKIKQNLFWALIYNCICIPLSIFGVFTPVIAGAAMAMSSVSVVSNSLLLKKVKL